MLPLLPTLLLLSGPAQADVVRFAVVAGNNEGAADTLPLYFAEKDAQKMAEVLTGPGEVAPDRLRLVLGSNRNELMSSLVGLRGDVALERQRGNDTLVFFYYSGHADDSRLQLGRSWVTWPELKDLLERTGADVRIGFIDACQSGAMTSSGDRRKGGSRAPGFVIEPSEKLGATGQVVFTSSAGDEASQESDAIGGSYFTHHLVSGLSGPADDDGDGRVTVHEAWQYSFRETVFDTSRSATGIQHPTYSTDLSGYGDVVVSNLSAAGSTLVFPGAMRGRFSVYDRNNGHFVAGVHVEGDDIRLALRPGTYLVQERYPTHLQEARINLRDGATVSLDGATFAAVEYEDDTAKGSIDKEIRRADLPELSLRIVSGGRGFRDAEVKAAYLPDTLAAGAEARFNWRSGKWVAADVLSGSAASSLTIEGLDYPIPVRVTSTTFGASAGFSSRPDIVQAGIGLRLAGVHFHRSFQDPGVTDQDLFTVAPGLVMWAGVHPGRIEIDLELRSHFLPYTIDDIDHGLGFSELALAVGYRF